MRQLGQMSLRLKQNLKPLELNYLLRLRRSLLRLRNYLPLMLSWTLPEQRSLLR